jgi:sirohydrochlorin ferrochelatase
MTPRERGQADLLLVAYGELRPGAANRSLLAHAARIAARWQTRWVGAAVLHGTPSLEEALEATARRQVQRLLVYPVFMSDGYMVTQVLPQRLARAARAARVTLTAPLGLDRRLGSLLLRESVRTAETARLPPARTRLLVVGHGSRSAREPAIGVLRMVESLRRCRVFASVEPAFIEERPFLRDRLSDRAGATVFAGFFSGEGVHACRDVRGAIEEAGAQAAFTGPIGAHPRVSGLIMQAVADASAAGSQEITTPWVEHERPSTTASP